MKNVDASPIEHLRSMIDAARSIVFFGGAGVSTESGIPDFRSEDAQRQTLESFGLPAEAILSADSFYLNTEIFYRYVRTMLYRPDAQPGPPHLSLAELERGGAPITIVTQNIDGLHQRAGSTVVHELHGTLENYHCIDCGKQFVGDEAMQQLDQGAKVPLCTCGGLLKPDVVLYQEGLPEDALAKSAAAIANADLLIVAGTSLVVQPAASLISFFQGENLVIINKTPTDLDSYASLVFHDYVGKVLGAVTGN